MEKVIRPRAIIVDIDNVLVDARALEIYTPADPHSRGGWDIFHQHLHEVTINDFIVNLVNLYRNEVQWVYKHGSCWNRKGEGGERWLQ